MSDREDPYVLGEHVCIDSPYDEVQMIIDRKERVEYTRNMVQEKAPLQRDERVTIDKPGDPYHGYRAEINGEIMSNSLRAEEREYQVDVINKHSRVVDCRGYRENELIPVEK